MNRFWRWLHQVSEARIRKAHMQKHHHDRRCPNCGRWGALYGWSARREVDPMHDALTCGACGHESVWAEDMCPFPVDPQTHAPLPKHRMAAKEGA